MCVCARFVSGVFLLGELMRGTGLVVEDAPSGLRAGRAAGAKTVAVCTSHTRRAIQDSGVDPDFIIRDLTG